MDFSVKWRGQSAEYTTDERQIVRQLPVKEQFIVHTLKSFTDGEIQDSPSRESVPNAGEKSRRTTSDGIATQSGTLYTDPEDIPFGDKPKRVKKLYAVAWSWRKHKIHKTKKRCEERIRAWKTWKERQGWTVIRFASGYLAELGETREVIQLHEYEAETKERLP